MATCKDCIHYEVCKTEKGSTVFYREGLLSSTYDQVDKICGALFKDHSRFVELNIAKKIKHTADIDKMREFHKLGIGNGMGERSIFWTCSNCELWVSLAHKFCPNCGAKFESEQALKERENSD